MLLQTTTVAESLRENWYDDDVFSYGVKREFKKDKFIHKIEKWIEEILKLNNYQDKEDTSSMWSRQPSLSKRASVYTYKKSATIYMIKKVYIIRVVKLICSVSEC